MSVTPPAPAPAPAVPSSFNVASLVGWLIAAEAPIEGLLQGLAASGAISLPASYNAIIAGVTGILAVLGNVFHQNTVAAIKAGKK